MEQSCLHQVCVLLKMLLLLLLLSLTRSIRAVPQVQGLPLTCDNQFVLYDNFCYRYFGSHTRKPFHNAQKLCSRYESSLVSLHTRQEEHFVVDLTLNTSSGFWIGLNDEDGPSALHKEGVFKWSSGEEFNAPSYCHWKEGEPANKRHLDCVRADSTGWAMAPGGCGSARLPFVCKRKACPVGMEWKGALCVVTEESLEGTEISRTVLLVAVVMVTVTLSFSSLWFVCHRASAKELFPT